MSFEVILQTVLLGLLQGGIYALVACGLTLIYGVMKIVSTVGEIPRHGPAGGLDQ